MKNIFRMMSIATVVSTTIAYADVPVEDAYSENNPTQAVTSAAPQSGGANTVARNDSTPSIVDDEGVAEQFTEADGNAPAPADQPPQVAAAAPVQAQPAPQQVAMAEQTQQVAVAEQQQPQQAAVAEQQPQPQQVAVAEQQPQRHAEYAPAPTQSKSSFAPPQAQAEQNTAPMLSAASLPIPQRVARLEQQVTNMQGVHVIDQLNAMQQQMQDLQGRIDVAAHQLKVLQAQQQAFYQDVDTRLTKLNNGNVASNRMPSSGYQTSNGNVNTEAANEVIKTASQATNHDLAQEETILKEQEAYEGAYNYVKSKQYTTAIKAMSDYLQAYPQGRFSLNAHYWLGELYMVTGNNPSAQQEFSTIVMQYPKQPKVAEAMLKLAMLANQTGNYNGARAQFAKVVRQYPETPSARLAQEHLKQMAQAGR